MNSGFKKLIFISGAPRSGTTWLAKLLSLSKEINSIDGEPFHPKFSQPMYGIKWPYYYHYLIAGRDDILADQLKNAFNLRWNIQDVVRRIKNVSDSKGSSRAYLRIPKLYFQFLGQYEYQLIKDPNAIFSCQQIYDLYFPKMIILIKHPAAFVSSMLRVEWGFYFEALLNQQELMNDLLPEYVDEIKSYTGKAYNYNIFQKSILLWKLFYSVVEKYRRGNHDWLFIRHEDISNDPEFFLGEIFDYLNIPLTSDIKPKIKRYTNSDNDIENRRDIIHELRRNSRELATIWKKRLTKEQVQEIKVSTGDLWPAFYSETDW